MKELPTLKSSLHAPANLAIGQVKGIARFGKHDLVILLNDGSLLGARLRSYSYTVYHSDRALHKALVSLGVFTRAEVVAIKAEHKRREARRIARDLNVDVRTAVERVGLKLTTRQERQLAAYMRKAGTPAGGD